MAKNKGFLKSRRGVVIMNFIYGFAAAIVIIGALFKILHLQFANEMLIIGMVTEAIVFLISSIDPPGEDYEWERVYPQLADSSLAPTETPSLNWMNDMPKIDGHVFSDLSDTLTGLNTNVSKLSSVADAAGATNEYTARIKEATGKIESLNSSYGVAVTSMGSFAAAADDARAYHEQVQAITRNLGSLNNIYELELQDAKTHLKSLNQFYASMSQAMASMAEASKDAEQYKQGMVELNKNLQKLNTVYGNILSAMSGGAR
ncbi:MAG: gliding motility protein GldL [Bacteroidia bacterium]|jgi:gliding motility-associated protein GldL|nr:gliding motility protein GldL [Bacteroidia bacterium]